MSIREGKILASFIAVFRIPLMIICQLLTWSMFYYSMATDWSFFIPIVLMFCSFILMFVLAISYNSIVDRTRDRIKERILKDPRSSNIIDLYPIEAMKERPLKMQWRFYPSYYIGYLFVKRNGSRLIAQSLKDDTEIDLKIKPGTNVMYQANVIDNYLMVEGKNDTIYFSRLPDPIYGTKKRNLDMLKDINRMNRFKPVKNISN